MIRRILAQIHLWLGLILCLPLVLLGLTGSVLVFEDELREAFAPPLAASPGEARPVADMIAAARNAAPEGYVPLSYGAPPLPGRLAWVRLGPPRRAPGPDAVRVEVDPVTLQTYPDQQAGLLRQVFFLHANLLVKNREGRQLVGGLGVVMLAMGLSGLVNWWPRRGQWRRSFGVSRAAGGVRLHREMHGMAGIWGLAVFLVVSFGGVYLAFPETVRSVVDALVPARDLRAAANAIKVEPISGARPLAVDEAIALARSRVPDTTLRMVFLPSRPEQPLRVLLMPAGAERMAPSATVFVDPWRSRVVEVFEPRSFSAGETMLAWQHALHAGHGFGRGWQMLVFLSGFLPLLFVVTGVTMWWLKRRRRAAPAAVSDPLLDPAYTPRRAGE